jgi:hypothetical protein
MNRAVGQSASERFVYFAFDTETHPFAPGLQQPPMVCVSFGNGRVLHRRDPECRREVERMYAGAERGQWTIGGLNTAFDLAELCVTWPELLLRTFQLLDVDGRVTCAIVRQKLIDIATGHYWKGGALIHGQRLEYNMEDIAKRLGCPIPVDKANPWRLRYQELDAVAVSGWPEEARRYASDDGVATQWILEAQDRIADPRWFVDQWNQMRHAFAFQLVHAWGMRTDLPVVSAYAANIKERAERDEQRLLALGLVKPKKGGGYSRNMAAIQEYAARTYAARGISPPTTPGSDRRAPQIKIDEDSCDLLGDPLLSAIQAMGSAKSKRGKPGELAEGLYHPIHTRFDSLIATGRSASSDPPMQNRPTKPGDRECVVPRPGCVFGVYDYTGLELSTLAQSCLFLVGRSRLAEVINGDGDAHCMIGCQLLHIPLDEMLKRKANKQDLEAYNARQAGKIANFGLGGGLGWKVLIYQARVKYDQILTERQAKNLISLWKETWPEMPAYFAFNEDLCAKGGKATIVQLQSGRWRGDIPYTETCNTWFQGLGADTAKTALYVVVRECYVGNGALRGSRPVHFVHDEIVTEMPEEIAHEAAHEQQRIMEGVASIWVPNVKLVAEGHLARRWSKQAKAVKDKSGRLIPWELTREIAHKIPDEHGKLGTYDWLGEAVAQSTGYAAV